MVPFFDKSCLHPSAGQLDQPLPNIGVLSFLSQLEAFTRIGVVRLRFG